MSKIREPGYYWIEPGYYWIKIPAGSAEWTEWTIGEWLAKDGKWLILGNEVGCRPDEGWPIEVDEEPVRRKLERLER